MSNFNQIDKIVLVTKRTALQELSDRFGTKANAKFVMQQAALRSAPASQSARQRADEETPDYAVYERSDAVFQVGLARLRAQIPARLRVQQIDSGFLPTYTFGEGDLIVVLGPDGLVVNTAKYLNGQLVLAVNPDPATIDGVLLPFTTEEFGVALARVLDGTATVERLTMAEARLDDGQSILAVNDLFIGQRSHVSARYRIGYDGDEEDQSSSGVIVSTGTGSTGWYRSVVTGALRFAAEHAGDAAEVRADDYRFARTADELRFAVREPWESRVTGAEIVAGTLRAGETLQIVSQMPQGGCVFSDGIEADYLPFASGTTATIGVAARKVALVVRDRP
jgi:NAD kinase